MKLNLKIIVLVLCCYVLPAITFAQSPGKSQITTAIKSEVLSKPFLGIWELFKVTTNDQPFQNYPPGYIKIYNEDSSFSIIRVQNGGSVIKGSGYFVIDTENSCREADKAEDLLSKGFKINYKFSEDKKTLSISFSYQQGVVFTEVYRKLEPMPKP